jgi:UDP-3-O-[3-hydroxymyristoyl] N-acetylglucosamine deacetylase
MKPKIMIVDDEEPILKVLSGVLQDEGYICLLARNGKEALDLFQKERPQVVLLDIWMPDMDGLELLKRIKDMDSECSVIMISGHATVATAVKAMKMGAADFLEKPLSIDSVLMALKREERGRVSNELKKGELWKFTWKESPSGVQAPQKTIKKSAVLHGTGLHSGQKTGLILLPQPPFTGILFYDLAEDVMIPANVDHVVSTDFATSLGKEGVYIRTVEHLLATLHAYGITNLLIKVDREVPVMDGSAIEFCRLIEEVGLEEQEEVVEVLRVPKRYEVRNGDRVLVVEPSEELEIEFILPNSPFNGDSMRFVLKSPEDFKREIAPARTFAFLKDVERLSKMGLAGGGHLHNVLLLDEKGPVNTTLRFPNEPLRHKILDLLGDLYLLNRPLKAKIRATMTGHRENIAFLRMLKEDLGL